MAIVAKGTMVPVGATLDFATMEASKVFIDLALAAGVGLLVGLQRERAGSAIAGIRTFALIALTGAVAATLPDPAGAWAVAAGLIAVGVLCWVGNLQRAPGHDSPGVTTEAAMLLMLLVGALIVWGPRSAGIATGALTAVLLHAKPILHRFTQRLGEGDVRAIMQFAVIALIILPIAPDHAYDPFGVLNLRRIWLMVVLLVGISLGAYVAYRLLGERHGAIVASVLGGLISSTATTASFARRARIDPASVPMATLAILIASATMGLRLLVVLWFVAPEQWIVFAVPLGILLAAGAICVLIARLMCSGDGSPMPPLENPTQLKSALTFAALFALVLLASAAAREYFGDRGIYVVAFLSGLTDMDAISLSLGGQVAHSDLEAWIGARAVVIAFISNTIFKTAMAGTLGGRALLFRLAPLTAGQIAVGIALLFWVQGYPIAVPS